MRVSAPAIAVPAIAGLVAGSTATMATWEALRTALLPALSVIAAAVLVRLARGLPFTNADHFTLAQFRDVSSKLEANARKLRMLIFICLAALAGLIVFPSLYDPIERTHLPLWVPRVAEAALSGLLGYVVTYSFVRVVEVVQSDVSLLGLQSKIIEGVIAQKNAKNFQEAIAEKSVDGIAGIKGFGNKLL